MKWINRLLRRAKTTDDYGVSQVHCEYVNVYDPEKQVVIEMPLSELSPGMVAAEVDGLEGVVWIDPREISPSSYRHPPFSEDTRNLLTKIKTRVDEVYCRTLEQWEDGFRRDQDAEKEIAIWLHLSAVYCRLTSERNLTMDQKRDYFKVLLACTHSPEDHVLGVVELSVISREEAQEVMEAYYRE